MDFHEVFKSYISNEIRNNYKDNWDTYRYGSEPVADKKSYKSFFNKVKAGIKNRLQVSEYLNPYFTNRYLNAYKNLIDKFSFLYENLEDEISKKILINVLAYRILGYKKVKIDLEGVDYKNEMKKIENQFDKEDFVLPDRFKIKQHKIHLHEMGYPISVYLSGLGIFYDFVFKQYELNRQGLTIKVLPGETVIDGGGCFGDTALYFSFLTGDSGKVYAFEFIPDNISLFNKNMELNPQLSNNVFLSAFPLWDKSDINVYYKDNGPGSIVSFNNDFEFDGIVKTITLDDFVTRNNINKIGFIKLDIEGAEMNALHGAHNILLTDKPKLAIALYHNDDDFDRIPRFIKSVNPNYKFYFHHATINNEESVLFTV